MKTKAEFKEASAQLWCLPQFADREMDASFAEAIAAKLQEAYHSGLLAGLEEAAKIAEDWYCEKQHIGIEDYCPESDARYGIENQIHAKAQQIREGK